MGDFKKAAELVEEINKGLNEYKGKIQWNRVSYLYIEIAFTFFGLNNYKMALKWINRLLNEKDGGKKINIFIRPAKILNLLIHFEMGNKDLLESLIKSEQRFFEKDKLQYRTEIVFVNFLKELITHENKASVIDMMNDLRIKMKKDHKENTNYDTIQYWLESKIMRKSFAEAVKSKTLDSLL